MQIATVRSHEIWLSGTPLFCRSVAGSALTPALALDYLGEAGIGRVHFGGDEEPFLGDYPWHHANCGDLDL